MTDSPATRIAICISLLLLALPAVAGTPSDDAARLEAKREEWVQKYEELRAKTSRLEAELAQAQIDYSRGRSTKHLRGTGKAGLIEEIERLEKEVAESQAELQAFPDEARKQGALPGWFRDAGDTAPAAQASDDDSPFGSGSSRNISRPGQGEEPPEAEASDGDSSHGSLSDRRAKSRERRRLGRD